MWNHPHPDPWLNLGPGSVMLSFDNIAVCWPNSMAYTNSLSTTDYPSLSNFNLEIPSYMRANTGMSQEPYMHYSSAHSFSRFPPYYVQCGPFNQLTDGNISDTANPPTYYDTATYKREIPTVQIFTDNGSANGCHSAGSSSSHPVSIGLLESTHTLGPHCFPWDPMNMVSCYRSNNLLSCEEAQRYVTTRHANVIHPANISATIHSSNNFSDHFRSVTNTSALNVTAQWNHAIASLDHHMKLIPSEISSFNHEMNQLHGACHVTNITMELDGGCNFCPVPGQPTPDLVVDHSTYGQGAAYRANTSYRSMASEANLVDFRLPPVETVLPPRNSRRVSTIQHVNERIGTVRTRYDRDGDVGQIRWTLAVMNRSTFYGSRYLLDEHHDMRLDIDNMSYEELLALEERIGNVNTGLCEVAITRCLMETIYCSDQILADQEEGRCTVCLESYKNKDCLGILNCGHQYHAFCIKKWLLIKNVCPICKAPAMEDSL